MEADTRATPPAGEAASLAANAVLAERGERRVWRELWHNDLLLGLVSLVLVLGLWEAVSQLGLINMTFFSSPSQIAASFFRLFFVNGEIYPHLWASAQTGFFGILAAVLIGIP